MGFWFRYRRPLLIVAVMAILDFAGRVLLDFDMMRVAVLESGLFAVAAAALLWAAGRDRADSRVRTTDLLLASLVGLAALRALIWATTGNVFAANVVIILVAALLVAISWALRRRRAHRAEDHPDPVSPGEG